MLSILNCCICCECGSRLLPHHHYVYPLQLIHVLAVGKAASVTNDVLNVMFKVP